MMPDSGRALVSIPSGRVRLEGMLEVPPTAAGLVVFSHGSGSGRHSPRNQFVARVLQQSDFGTLLMDLLTEKEEAIDNQNRELRFDIGLLSKRLTSAVDWLSTQPAYKPLPIGIFGASTGAAAAIITAADRPKLVKSVVSRGGRPDLADGALERITAPTAFIVGGYDDAVLVLNQQARARMKNEVTLKVIPRATHLFEEPGALAQVAEFAAEWFTDTVTKSGSEPEPRNSKATE